MKKNMNISVKSQVVACAIIMVIFGLSLFGSTVATCQAKSVKLVIHDAAMSRGYTKAWEWWAKEVEKQTNGEVKFEFMWGGPLGGYKEALDSMKNGVYDMSIVPPSYVPSKLPLWTAFEIPFITKSLWAYDMLMWDMKDMPALKQEMERSGVRVMVTVNANSAEIMSRVPVRNLADLKNLKIRAYGMAAEVLKAFGAKPVSIPASQVYENMQRGVVDAAIMPWPQIPVKYGVYELSKYSLLLGGFAYIPVPFVMSLESWNKIPTKNQEIMTRLAEQALEKLIEVDKETAGQALAKMKEKGHEINHLSEAERREMVAVAKKTWEAWVEKQVKEGRPEARMVIDEIIKKAAEYEAKDPYK